jgi:hypothetical protein
LARFLAGLNEQPAGRVSVPAILFLPVSRLLLGKEGLQDPMKNLENNKAINDKPENETMKSLSFAIVSDISRLLVDKGFGQNPIDIVEALVFAMFIVADTYVLAKPDKDQAVKVIHGFYDDMQNHFIHKVIIEDHKITDAAEIQSVSDKFHELSRSRFDQYGEKFKQDISEPMALSCPTLVSFLLDNLFIQPLNKAEKLQLMGPVSDKILHFWAGCVQNFR